MRFHYTQIAYDTQVAHKRLEPLAAIASHMAAGCVA